MGVSRKKNSQGFEELCERNKINKRCVLEYSYTCEGVSDGLVLLPSGRLQIKLCVLKVERDHQSFG